MPHTVNSIELRAAKSQAAARLNSIVVTSMALTCRRLITRFKPSVCDVVSWAVPRHIGVKSALFDEMDFAKRDWVPQSGWPISRESLGPYFQRAAALIKSWPDIL